MAVLRDIMEKKVKTIKEDATLQELADLLIKNKLSGVPVINRKTNLIGYVSERDIIEAIASGDFQDKKVRDIMNKRVVSLGETTSLELVSKIFTAHAVKNIPVTRRKKLVGVVSRKQVINKLLSQYY